MKFDAAMDKIDMAALGKDKATVFYCNGPRCWKLYKSVVTAVKQGFKKVYWYRDGFPEWKAKGQPIETGE